MIKLDLPKKSQVVGLTKLEYIKRRKSKSEISDFAIIQGNNADGLGFTSGITYGTWATKTIKGIYNYTVNNEGKIIKSDLCYKKNGIRPVALLKDLKKYQTDNIFGITFFQYGEYPQTIVSDETLSEELEQSFQDKKLYLTGKTYATKVVCTSVNTPFVKAHCNEYVYQGKKYIRMKAEESNLFGILSNGQDVMAGDIYWVRVSPVTWHGSEKDTEVLCSQIIFSGVPFAYIHEETNYKDTCIKHFLDDYLSNELIPSELNNLTKMSSVKKTNEQVVQRENKHKNLSINPYGLTFNDVSEEEIIKGILKTKVAIFIHGKSSDGKSARVKQIDPDSTIIYLRNATPESLNGKSIYNPTTGEMIDVKPTWLKKLEEKCISNPNEYHILFFDEITNALPSIQGIAFNIILDKEVNGIWHLPENVRIIAAGNEMTDSLAANQLAEPLFNRFAHVYIKTDLESWIKWANEHNIHPAIRSYILYTKGRALRTDYNGETPNADPRKWEMASSVLYETKNPAMLRSLVGEEVTKEFIEFCQQEVITLEDVLNNNYDETDLKINLASKYATVYNLTQVDKENVSIVREFIAKLGNEFCSVFDSIWCSNNEDRLAIIAEERKKILLRNKK